MARRGWGRSVSVAVLSAATAAAAQVGLGYGLGIVSFARTAGIGDTATTSPGAWSAALAWTTLMAATSVVIGAVAGDRASGAADRGRTVRSLWRLMLAFAAAIGGTVVIALVLVPASAAAVPGNFAPQLLAAVYAAAGLLIGLVVAVMAMTARAIAANVFATAGWLWLLAIVVEVQRAVTGRPLSYVSPGVWKFTASGPVWHSYYLPGVLLMLGAALLIGGLASFPAAGRGAARLGIVISGGIGPLLVATAYVLAAPEPGRAPFEQLSAFYTAPYMVIAGLAGSMLVAAVGGTPRRSRKAGASGVAALTAGPAAAGPGTPTADASASGRASVPATALAPPGEPPYNVHSGPTSYGTPRTPVT